MNKKEIHAEVNRRLAQGDSKTVTFKALRGQGVRDAVLANMIASYAEPARVEAHATAVKVLVLITGVQLVMAAMVTFVLSLSMGWLAAVAFTTVVGAFCYLFVWGFRHHRAWAYNVSIFLTVINLHRHFKDFGAAPVMNTLLLLFSLGVLGLTLYLRLKLFPDFVFITPQKIRGEYKFSS